MAETMMIAQRHDLNSAGIRQLCGQGDAEALEDVAGAPGISWRKRRPVLPTSRSAARPVPHSLQHSPA